MSRHHMFSVIIMMCSGRVSDDHNWLHILRFNKVTIRSCRCTIICWLGVSVVL